MTLPELIWKLEIATEGSRELDCMIFEAVAMSGEFFGSKITSFSHDTSGRYVFNTEDGRRHLEAATALNYTTSLDAALKLVPEGRQWILDCHDKMDGGSWRYSAHVSGSSDKSWWRPTPALALCIACLRARQQ